jgi:hypothetical protein
MAITKVKAGQVTSKLAATGSTVRGLDDKLAELVSVKDFGAVGDGVADDTAAIQAFFTYVTTNGCSGVIPEGDYLIVSRISITLGPKGFSVEGGGVEGTRFIVASTFSGSTQAFRIVGSGNQPGFFLGGFSIRSSGSGSGSATIGFQIGDESPGATIIAGFNTSTIKNVFVADFAVCWKVIHARLFRFEDCSAWNNNFGSASTCLQITQNGKFTGDLVFDRCQFVSAKAAGKYCLDMTSNVGPYNIANGNGSIAGIKFRSCDFYAGDQAIRLYVANSAWLMDVWFVDGCQIDQEVTSCVYGESFNVGAFLGNIHFDGVYANKATGPAFNFSSTGTGGTIKDVWVSNCAIFNAQDAAINFFGAGVIGPHVNDNTIIDCATTAGAISFNGTTGLSCTGNRVRRDIFNAAPFYLVDVLAGATDVCVIGNDGAGVALVSPVRDLSGDVTKIIANNPGYNPRSQQTITVTASPFTYKNTSGAPEYVYVSGGTLSNVTINNAFGVVATTNNCWLVPQGRTITVTYTDAPTMFSLGL